MSVDLYIPVLLTSFQCVGPTVDESGWTSTDALSLNFAFREVCALTNRRACRASQAADNNAPAKLPQHLLMALSGLPVQQMLHIRCSQDSASTRRQTKTAALTVWFGPRGCRGWLSKMGLHRLHCRERLGVVAVLRSLLTVQIDAAINPGNSGGPAMVNDRVVGVAFQGFSQLQNVGFIVPYPVVRHFLNDIAVHRRYTGFPTLGIKAMHMENDSE